MDRLDFNVIRWTDRVFNVGNVHHTNLEKMFGAVESKVYQLFDGSLIDCTPYTTKDEWRVALHIIGLIALNVIAVVAFIILCVMRAQAKSRFDKVAESQGLYSPLELKNKLKITQQNPPRRLVTEDRKLRELPQGSLVVVTWNEQRMYRIVGCAETNTYTKDSVTLNFLDSKGKRLCNYQQLDYKVEFVADKPSSETA